MKRFAWAVVLVISIAVILLPALAVFGSSPPSHSGTQLLWYGHSAFKLTTPSGKVILLDPWLTNPLNKTGKDDLARLDRADLILISHGHFDHTGDAVEIAKKTGARLVTTLDLGRAMVANAGYPQNLFSYDTQGNFGGSISLFEGEVRIRFVPAVHSSVVAPRETQGDSFSDVHYAGNPGGFVISIKNGPVIYHTGDTDLFTDMELIPLPDRVTVMLACIGDHFTMGPERAAEAVKLVKPAVVVPMHFGTFSALTGTPEAFAKALQQPGITTQLKRMQVGETLSL
jgi:L-ascorbate metabolism protein UlaG (beta-lactamase superfamily)